MARSQDNPHYQEETRCGHCYEEWPCTGSKNPYVSSGIHKWELDEVIREREERRRAARLRALQANLLLRKLGYTSAQLEISQDACVGQMVDCALLCEIITRLAKAEGIQVDDGVQRSDEVGRQGHVPGGAARGV